MGNRSSTAKDCSRSRSSKGAANDLRAGGRVPTALTEVAGTTNEPNSYKGSRIGGEDPKTGRFARLFNPRVHVWDEHFRWSDAGTRIIGTTAAGRVSVRVLRLNEEARVRARRAWSAAGIRQKTETKRGGLPSRCMPTKSVTSGAARCWATCSELSEAEESGAAEDLGVQELTAA